jgi:hypothetical protein
VTNVTERKNINIMDTLTVELVVTDGQVDVDASVEAFTEALEANIAERKIALSGVAEAVATLFDANKGAHIALPTIGSLVASALNSPPASFKTISARVQDYVRSNAKGDQSLFVSVRGRAGGTARRADMAVKA